MEECARNKALAESQGGWVLRYPVYVPTIPAIRWFKKVARDEEWLVSGLRPARPMSSNLLANAQTTHVQAELNELENMPEGPTVSVLAESDDPTSFSMSIASSDVSSCVSVMFYSRYRCLDLPDIVGLGTGSAMWKYNSIDGHMADVTAFGLEFADSAHSVWETFKSTCFGFCPSTCLVCACIWNIARFVPSIRFYAGVSRLLSISKLIPLSRIIDAWILMKFAQISAPAGAPTEITHLPVEPATSLLNQNSASNEDLFDPHPITYSISTRSRFSTPST